MLSDQHRRELAAIERHLIAEDPALAHLLARWPSSRRLRVPARAVWAAIGFVTVLAGAAGLGSVLIPIGVVVLLGSVALSPLTGPLARHGPPGAWGRRPR
ncbi:DUF3040 domain-containing protein [Quadrisphaera sp. DSM 44207]|uniref:DUF3040 domain-containing protein n=1 Tax=Quadrisphaera sp. DSM 44207 TaxID=1881057 RepID=UPI000882EAD5|nr:DUF3040 domain-containing protein [Quadrisphaera sp. DSM 44207]SDQ63450.1 Protein of unknown function [Quadrisphaera sp. DSM 44207]